MASYCKKGRPVTVGIGGQLNRNTQFKLYAFDYVTIQKTNLGSVADEFHHRYNREKKDYLKDLKKWNPKWIKKDIPIGEGINLVYPYSYHLGYGKVEDKLTSPKEDELQLNFGYSASIGTYSQGGSTTRINFKQNSPGTVQVMTTKKMSNHFFSDGSMYLSKIMDAEVSGANNSIAKIPYDFGATLYLGKKFLIIIGEFMEVMILKDFTCLICKN